LSDTLLESKSAAHKLTRDVAPGPGICAFKRANDTGRRTEVREDFAAGRASAKMPSKPQTHRSGSSIVSKSLQGGIIGAQHRRFISSQKVLAVPAVSVELRQAFLDAAQAFCSAERRAQGKNAEPFDGGSLEVLADRFVARSAEFTAAFPAVAIDGPRLAARVVESLQGDLRGPQTLDSLHFNDLCIAVACTTHDTRALAYVTASVLPEACSSLARFRSQGVVEADVLSAVRERLLLARPDEQPGIASYGGLGPLLGWLRVIVTRTALNQRRSRKSEESREEEIVRELLGDDASPELTLLRADAALHFKEAFAEAVRCLPEDERDALRMHLYEGLSIDDLARIFGVHRATAARWLTRAREGLYAVTRERLVARLGCSDSEVDSMVRLMMSRVDLSLTRVLGKKVDAADVTHAEAANEAQTNRKR
jgi:RNA polymerase sigma-70 factor, ECF subfamily